MPYSQKVLFAILLMLILSGCKNTSEAPVETSSPTGELMDIKYADGYEIENFGDYKVISVKNAWPGTDRIFKYALVEENTELPNSERFDAIVQVPIKRLVVTSTTHIPSLEMLNETEALIGFPSLDFISSEKTRERILKGKIKELGQNEDINPEIVLNLSPEAVVGFAMDGNNPTFSTLQKAGIPVLYNADWTETSPLGKAEWIKFFGVLLNKNKEADSIFKSIEIEYLNAKKIASQAKKSPTVISGAMYKDVWYMPQGGSWGAQFIADANGDYLWKDTKGTGSASLNLESVLEKGSQAEIWIGPGQYTSMESLKNASMVYTQFKAFIDREIYSYNLKKGETGGSIYFELAPNRPDVVLKDFIKILHPELLPEHQLYFFQKIK